MRSPVALTALALAVLAGALPGQAAAHALGEVFTLPVPLWLYLGGAGTAVAASFVVSVAVVRPATSVPSYPIIAVPRLAAVPLSLLLRALGLAWWLSAIGIAFVVGDGTPLPAVLAWIGGWVALPIVALLLGNPWPSLSPFRTLHELLALATRALLHRPLDAGLPYPPAAARWPAVATLLAALWCELVLPGATAPGRIGPLMVGYTLLTLLGMSLFGRVAWLRNAELFEVLLGWFGRVGPVGRRVVDPDACYGCAERCDPAHCVDCPECAAAAELRDRRAELRPWLIGLTEARRAGWSDAAFIVLVLSGVTYDGLRETSLWGHALDAIFPSLTPSIGPFWTVIATDTFGLVGLWLAFLLVFALAGWLTRAMNDAAVGTIPLGSVSGEYAATLLPIAGGYLIAHYLTLVIQGAVWLPALLRDPLQTGAPALAIPAAAVWYLSVAAIVGGHVAAVVLAHRIALRDAGSRPVVAGLPLVLAMVGYTVLSLWIIAQPIALEPGQPLTDMLAAS